MSAWAAPPEATGLVAEDAPDGAPAGPAAEGRTKIPVAIVNALARPVDASSLAAFRILFGVAMVVLSLRFFTHGWIDADYRAPKVFFHYWGFSWVKPWPGIGMSVHYAVMAASALMIAAGALYRPACVVFALAFTYAHLCDKSNYLNHYYLVSLVAALLAFVPLDREWSVRVWRAPAERRPFARAWILWLLRFQIGVVYFFGGVAKLGADWLLRGEPLRIWLPANAELPLLGPLFHRPEVAIAFSAAGAIFDLTIVFFLLARRTRALAWLVLVAFHLTTAALFRIGMFPWIMIAASTLMFDPSWARRRAMTLARGWGASRPVKETAEETTTAGRPLTKVQLALLGAYALVQLAVPLRHCAYPGNTLWTEEGFRFAWRVMLIEKSGELDLTVVEPNGRRTLVSPRAYLTPFQARMASTQPDMILELAHVVADDYARRGHGPVEVYADAQVSWNGRRRAPLIAPTIDLARENDGLGPKPWILPAPTDDPEF